MSTTTVDETVPIDLGNGVTFDADYNTLVNLYHALDERISEAYERRMKIRNTFVDPESHGLIPVPLEQDGTDISLWVLPGGFGTLPYGVPLLRFEKAHLRQYRWRGRRSGDPEADETWSLVFSNLMNTKLATVNWDDRDGFARLAESLRTTPRDVLAIEATLLADGNTLANLSARANAVTTFIERALALPPISHDTFGTITVGRETFTIQPTHIIHPQLCRFVTLPSMATISNTSMSVTEVDKALGQAGLLGVPTLRGQNGFRYTRISRVAVTRGHRSALGSLSEAVTEAIASAHASRTTHGSRGWNADVLIPEPLSYDEWPALLP